MAGLKKTNALLRERVKMLLTKSDTDDRLVDALRSQLQVDTSGLCVLFHLRKHSRSDCAMERSPKINVMGIIANYGRISQFEENGCARWLLYSDFGIAGFLYSIPSDVFLGGCLQTHLSL